ncbi:MAG: Hypoxia induced protein conserved region [Roseibaca calidilacus]|uniref:Hypoxia induced protein conserved region n=1 Tax=Roseibaca calidilacus TaxID=1666912 RepID=A0A0P7WHG6_9RHOB|nr:twin transmembrane helix small protein [Roseibaca calidilacus]KPP89934.1 MAG: Hypoxia induced protein conserved region [Roseibaca calidilacus]CUX81029.1 Hypoxia induced protein conserved region [Roseibaca calidilacus]
MFANDPLFIAAVVACLVVLGVLVVGIGGFGRGGAFNQKHGNRMMRYRLIAQFIAVLLIVAFVYFRQKGA